MKKTLFTLFTMLACMQIQAATADWYLYLWSDTYGLDGNVGQFETTDNANVFVISSCNITAQGINFGVHNSSWSVIYGWDSESVTTTGQEVTLATADVCNGWFDLPAGTYKVTFNSSALTIRFDEAESSDDDDDDDEGDYPDHSDSRQFLRGGDLTMVTYIEDWGAVFRYEDGTAGDVFDILEHYGVNLARLRLYNEPGTSVKDGSTTYRTPIMSTAHPSGYPYGGEDDILALALRAKNHNMKICLTFNLTDYWSHATMQMIPAAWSSAGSLTALGDSVYNFVYRFMGRMQAQGTLPEYVSVGNETNSGLLFQDTQGSSVSYGGKISGSDATNAVYLFNRAYSAIKAVSPSSQVIIHHSYGHSGKTSICRSYFQTLSNNGCNYDIVGASYYPTWASQQNASDATPTGMLAWASAMETAIGKPIMLMETGYSWTQYRPSGRNGGNYEGQLGTNGNYNEATEKGQRNFICTLHDAIASDANILGYMYWDPIFVDQQVSGSWIKSCWAEKYDSSYNTWWEDGNVISNTTLFDYEGYPLSALYQEINSRQTADPGVITQQQNRITEEDSTAQKILREGQVIILRNGKIFDVLGKEITR